MVRCVTGFGGGGGASRPRPARRAAEAVEGTAVFTRYHSISNSEMLLYPCLSPVLFEVNSFKINILLSTVTDQVRLP